MQEHQTEMDISRVEREQKFHNQRFADDSTRTNKVGKFYKVAESIKKEYEQFLIENCKGLEIIEYGCGTGSYAFDLAKNQATKVTGIDISPVAIQVATAKAISEGIEGNLSFEVMNAEELTFNHYSIDMICGSGILHHLELEKAMKSIVNVLKPVNPFSLLIDIFSSCDISLTDLTSVVIA
jgi:ubiquinone/menaquinone biosynthesis C-methylase UbiE